MKQSSAPIAAAISILLVVLPLFYVLSIGPAAWLAGQDIIDGSHGSFVDTFYSPLFALGTRIPVFEDGLNWYLACWASGK